MKAFLESLPTFGGDDNVLPAGETETRLTSIGIKPKNGIVMAKEKTGSDFVFIAQDEKADR